MSLRPDQVDTLIALTNRSKRLKSMPLYDSAVLNLDLGITEHDYVGVFDVEIKSGRAITAVNILNQINLPNEVTGFVLYIHRQNPADNFTWNNSNLRFPGNLPVALSDTPGAVDVFVFQSIAFGEWFVYPTVGFVRP